MTTRFLKAMPDILLHEGGYNNIKEDRGGATNFGISLLFLKGLSLKDGDFNDDGRIDWLDIKALTKEEAQELYYDNFWRPLYDKLPERTAYKVFDVAVNAGHHRAHVLLQTTLQALGSNVVADGIIGKQTLLEVAKYSDSNILNTYCHEQADFYRALVQKKPINQKFLKGWLNRAAWKPK